jgi:ATP/maltotriose-dependent transcriptional regulator MalT/DNA-binding SARP family transcriptional activator
MHRKPALAKLSRPRLYDALPRDRLFASLDAARQRPLIWIEGPPGAGKTTLVASYLEARGLSHIWYQIDAGDADPATLFYYLGLALPDKGRKRKLLPLLSPELLPQLSEFSRRFFRELFGRMPAAAVIVLDNYQEAPADSVLHAILRDAIEEIPQGMCFIVLSRTEPPPELARCLATNRIAQIGWESLRLTLAETRVIGSLGQNTEDSAIAEIFRRSQGWAAGVILMLEQLRRGGSSVPNLDETREGVFNFFAQEIFNRATLENQQILLVTAFLPQFSGPLAEKLTGNSNAPRLLDYLYRRHLFTYRRGGPDGVYQYHALFREFLLNCARQTYTDQGMGSLARRAALLLEEAGDVDDAIQLHLQARDWDEASRLILRHASRLLGHGRGQTLREWIGALPTDMMRVTPWLDYWHATSIVQISQDSARQQLEKVYQRFRSVKDRVGQALSVAGIIEAYYFEFLDFSPLDKWIQILEEILASQPNFPDLESELRAYSSLLAGIWYRQPDRASAHHCATRVRELMKEVMDVNQKVIAAAFLLVFQYSALDFDAIDALEREISPILSDSRLTAVNKTVWLWRRGWVFYQQARYAEATASLEEARSLGETQGLRHAVPNICYFQIPVALAQGDMKTAESLTDHLCRSVNENRPIDRAFRAGARGLVDLYRGNGNSAVQLLENSVALIDESGLPYSQTLFRIAHAYALTAVKPAQEISRHTAEIRDMVSRACWHRHFGCEPLILDAYAALKLGDIILCHRLLREVLAMSRQIGYTCNFRFVPEILPRLLSEALDVGIETDHVGSLIRKYCLPPVDHSNEFWPWPIKIFTLGSFSVLRDELPVQMTGKPQVKPLELLKALIASSNMGTHSSRLAEWLWPDADGDAASRSFETTLHRLRRLLGNHEALRMEDGKLSLNPRVCWVDTWAVERALADEDSQRSTVRLKTRPETINRLYRGHFLANEPQRPWMLPMRERLRTMFTRHVRQLGEQCQVQGQWAEAAAVFEKAIELDSLAEEFYRQLMRCQIQMDMKSEAMTTFRRCREMLSIVLGVQPGAEIRALFKSLSES